MDKFLSPFRQSKLLNTLFLTNILISFHYALIIYINSSLLSNFFSDTQVSALYIIGAIFNTIFLLNTSKIMEKIGSYNFIMGVATIEFLSILGMALSTNPFLVAFYFIAHTIAISLILFNMDIFVESLSNESSAGGIRATYLTTSNITILIAPAVVALMLLYGTYSSVYIFSTLFIIPLYYLIQKFKKIEAKPVKHIRVTQTIQEYIKNKDLYNVFTSQFLLQLFYAFMVVYTPLYLREYVGFSWSEIGVMFTIMLLPFVLFELPLGELEDEKYGEKEFLTIGFIIMGLATLFISFITTKSFWIWTTILFISRIGASFVEVSSESYFFKLVNQKKTDIISFFRISRPISYIVAPLLATLVLQFIPFQFLFIMIGLVMLLGVHFAMNLKDTK